MSDLQQSFSEISRLVESVSLPPIPSPRPDNKDIPEEEVRWKRGVERLKLMILAEGWLWLLILDHQRDPSSPSLLCLAPGFQREVLYGLKPHDSLALFISQNCAN